MATKQIPLTLFERSRPYLCISGGISFLCLAKWQQIRKEKKVEHLTLMETRLSCNAIDCPTSLTFNEIHNDYKFTKVSISGDMDPNNNIIISPRKPPYSAKIKNININDPKQLGGYIYSPITTKSGDMIIVNQGWIPKEQLPTNTSNEKDINKKTNVSVNFEGLITPLKNIPKFVKEAANFNVSDTIWPFMDNELLKQRYEMDINDNKQFIVVDAMKPENDIGIYPHKVQKSDLLMVNIPPIQHSVYVWLMCCSSIACFYYSYYFFKHPRSIKKLNALKYKQRLTQLNAPRGKKSL
eukprot:416308_1